MIVQPNNISQEKTLKIRISLLISITMGRQKTLQTQRIKKLNLPSLSYST